MTVLSKDRTVGEIVAERPARSKIFEQLGIDYCCGGKRPLEQACEKRGLDANTVLKMLEAIEDARVSHGDNDPNEMSLSELANHIENRHHTYLRQALPRLNDLLAKVVNRHGSDYGWLEPLQECFMDLDAALTEHMTKEERILFPMIRNLEEGFGKVDPGGPGLESPIHCMEMEHDSAGNALRKMRALSNGFTPPEGACNSFRAMLDGLAELEQDLHQHIHLENNILFPGALSKFKED